MPNKFTDLEVENIVKENGFKLLDKYKQSNCKMKMADNDGYLYYISVNLVHNVNSKKHIFGKCNPYTIDNINLWISRNRNDIKLKSSKFDSATSKMDWVCLNESCGCTFDTDWHGVYSCHRGCPYCVGKRVSSRNCLATLYPKLLEEWDFELNKNLSPYNIVPNSHKYANWICRECGYKWNSVILSRVYSYNNVSGCPSCNGKAVSDKNRLSILFPKISSEWNYDKNDGLLPENFSYGMSKNVWWRCSYCGNEWKSTINNRTNGKKSCPICRKSKGEISINKFLLDNDIIFSRQYRIKECKYKRPLPFDFAIFFDDKSLNFLLEYDGEFHFREYYMGKKRRTLEESQRNDEIKNKYCEDNNIKLLRIPYWDKNNIEKILNKEFLSLRKEE